MDTQSVAEPKINFDNSFSRSMEGFYVPCSAARVSAPKLILFNHTLAKELGLKATDFESDEGAAIFSGQAIPDGAAPLAQVYAGHQFGHLSPQDLTLAMSRSENCLASCSVRLPNLLHHVGG